MYVILGNCALFSPAPITIPEIYPPDSAALRSLLAEIESLHPKKIDLDLSRIERLLTALSNPHHALPPVVHIAGTNGKGSTAKFLFYLAQFQGKTCHLYTSPHLVSFRERIVLGGQEISESKLISYLQKAKQANQGAPITFFELTSAAAFLAFADHPADFTILETGLGGRLDTTNVVTDKAATALTYISMDHKEFLGDTLSKIMVEKAAIARPGCPAILAPQQDLATSEKLAQLVFSHGGLPDQAGKDWYIEIDPNGFTLRDASHTHSYSRPQLAGDFQCENAATALRLARALGLSCQPEICNPALTACYWPARLQPLPRGLWGAERDTQIWLDGGHNDSAGAALAQWLKSGQKNLCKSPDRPIVMICAMMANKDHEAWLRPMAPYIDHLICLALPTQEHAGVAPDILARKAKEIGYKAVHVAQNAESSPENGTENWPEICRRALGKIPGTPAQIIVAGSLYLAGEVLKHVLDNGSQVRL